MAIFCPFAHSYGGSADASLPDPAGYHAVTPYLTVRVAAEAIEFYKAAFGATELMRFAMPDGTVAHAEVEIGGSRVMLGDEMPGSSARGPQTLGGTTGGLCLYCRTWTRREPPE